MLTLLCPKVIVNIAIPVLMAASTLAQCLGMLNTFFLHITQLALVIATVTGWLAQPTKLLHGMVKRPLGCDNIFQRYSMCSLGCKLMVFSVY